MITKDIIDRINYLGRKKKNEGLTPEEKEEQKKLRRQYIDAFKEQVKTTLEVHNIPKKKKN